MDTPTNKLLLVVNPTQLGDKISSQIIKLIEIINTNPNLKVGLYALAGILSLLAMMQPEHSSQQIVHTKQRRSIQNNQQSTTSEYELSQNNTFKNIKSQQRSSWFGWFRRNKKVLESSTIETSVLAKEHFSPHVDGSVMMVSTPTKKTLQTSDKLNSSGFNDIATLLSESNDHFNHKFIASPQKSPYDDEDDVESLEWSAEKAAFEEMILNLQRQLEKYLYEIDVLNKTKNLIEGQFRAESNLRAEAEENLRLLKVEYEKQLRNIESQFQLQKRRNIGLEEKIHILETKLEYFTAKRAEEDKQREQQQQQQQLLLQQQKQQQELEQQQKIEESKQQQQSTAAAVTNSYPVTPNQPREDRHDIAMIRQNSYSSFSDYLYHSSPAVRKLAMSDDNTLSSLADTRLASPNPNLLIFGTN